VYTLDRPLTEAEAEQACAALDRFTRQWTAHDQALRAGFELFDNQVLILLVDETQAGASGCSIDKSVHFLEALGAELGVDFFERMRFGWIDGGGTLRFAERAALSAERAAGRLPDDTPMLNTLAQTRQELQERWLLPLGESWHRRLI
jgi:hypothetical protein